MPLQLYDKEQILDACIFVFARHGYENTSTTMLAEGAGVSKALLFHHFRSKKELYLSILDRCFEKGRTVIGFDPLAESLDFFEVREKLSISKFEFKKKNPDVYQVLKEAFFATPEELKTEIAGRYGAFMAEKNAIWERLFEKVPLRKGVERIEAFELLRLTLDYFDNKYLSEILNGDELDEAYIQRFIEQRNRFLAMIRYGIEK